MLLGMASSIYAAPIIIQPNTKYTVTVGTPSGNPASPVNAFPNGTITVTSDAVPYPNTGISFNFPSSVFASCTGTMSMLTLVQDSTGTIVRQSVGPCPNTAASVATPINVNPTTTKQAVIQESGMTGTVIDPVTNLLATFLFRANLSDFELQQAGQILSAALNQIGNTAAVPPVPSGFFDYLTTVRGMTATQLDAYKSNVQNRMNNPAAGSYIYYMNLAAQADAGTPNDVSNRGLAYSALLQVLIDSSNDPALPTQATDWVVEALESMSAVGGPLLQAATLNYNPALNNGTGGATDPTKPAISAVAATAIGKSFEQGLHKLKANRTIANFADAMTILNGSAADVQQFTTTASTFTAAMDAAFSKFEASTYVDPYSATAETDQGNLMGGAETTLMNDIMAAYDAFYNGLAASNARIATMIANMNCTPSATVYCPVAADFTMPNLTGTGMINWPIGKVVLSDWISGVAKAGGNMTYTRDTAAIPASMFWMGTCMVGTAVNPYAWDAPSCAAGTPAQAAVVDPVTNATIIPAIAAIGPGIWTVQRTDFTTWTGVPVSVQSVMGIGEDAAIRTATRDDVMYPLPPALPPTPLQVLNAETALTDSLYGTTPANGISGSIGGTTDGTKAITAAQADAVVQLSQDPNL